MGDEGNGLTALNGMEPSDWELAKAMKLLSGALPPLFKDLCPGCYHTFSTRLSSIASGLELSAYFKDNLNSHAIGDSSKRVPHREPVREEFLRLPAYQTRDRSDCESEDCHKVVHDHDDENSDKVSTVQTPEERERIRMQRVIRKANFVCMERIKGRQVNIVEGLELHQNIFTPNEQDKLVKFVYEYREKGIRNELMERTYTAPRKWMKGKGRETIQFGCCYNYATDKNGNPPGILEDVQVDPIPAVLKSAIRRLVRWRVLPADCVPDSCIINIYEEGDCIPPHIDHHDFLRPFCTLSLLSECDILFGYDLPVLGPGASHGQLAISLPVGSVLVLKGNGADVAKHCVPAVPQRRISVTFRKMDPHKLPLYMGTNGNISP